MKIKSVSFPCHKQAELIDEELVDSLAPDEVEGRTLTTLISPGTEINCLFLGKEFPRTPGYASVFEIERLGQEVEGFEVGDRVFSMGNHKSHQRAKSKSLTKVPNTMSSKRAVLTRLAMVSATTLMKTRTCPGDRAWISGFGPVGCLAAAQFGNAGYEVSVVEVDQGRRAIAEKMGYSVYAHCPTEDENLKKSVDIYVDCSGHESSILAGCKMVRRQGEVVMVGVPWKKRTDIDAHAILWEVFHNYVQLSSGWEWSLPREGDLNTPQNIKRNAEKCMAWLLKDNFIDESTIGVYNPEDCNDIYNALASQSLKDLFVVFDWTQVEVGK